MQERQRIAIFLVWRRIGNPVEQPVRRKLSILGAELWEHLADRGMLLRHLCSFGAPGSRTCAASVKTQRRNESASSGQRLEVGGDLTE
jgi:hypothetical protein